MALLPTSTTFHDHVCGLVSLYWARDYKSPWQVSCNVVYCASFDDCCISCSCYWLCTVYVHLQSFTIPGL